MDSFWKWLMRTNARGVLLAAVFGLLLVTTWWVWREFAPLEDIALPTSGKAMVRRHKQITLLSFVDEQVALGPLRLANNPFLSPVRRRLYQPALPNLSGLVPITPIVGIGPVTPRPPARVTPTVTPEKEPAGPPVANLGGRRTISLVYRGMLQRPDGTTMALIEDSETKASAFYPTSTGLYGMRVGKIDTEELNVTSMDGEDVTLRIGEPIVFQGE